MSSIFDLKYAELAAAVETPLAGGRPYRVVILRDHTLEPIEPYLLYLGRDIGLDIKVTFGAYNNLIQEAHGGGSGSLRQSDVDCILVFPCEKKLVPELTAGLSGLTAAQLDVIVERVKTDIEQVVTPLRQRTQGLLLWVGFASRVYPALGLSDAASSFGETALVSRLNEALRQVLKAAGNAYVIDLTACIARVGARKFHDPRRWHLNAVPYSLEGMREVAVEAGKYLRASNGGTRKCLILDCDNTLWGGVVGEAGLDGIELGDGHPGRAHADLQHAVLELHERGILIALCSKNDPETVWEVFDRHPGMVLRREHIAAHRINWHDKATNLRELAEELNLGLQSFVMIDDSPFETGLISRELPEVRCITLDGSALLEFRDRLHRDGWFETLSVSKEDRLRAESYRADAERRQLRETSVDLDSYLASLEMTLTIAHNEEVDIARAAQLCQRTNQFNLTTRRHREDDIRGFTRDQRHDVMLFGLSDRLGNLGNIGLAILRHEGDEAILDTLLMSCRAVGRQVEQAMLAECARVAQARKARRFAARYEPTAKNGLVSNLLTGLGVAVARDAKGSQEIRAGLDELRLAAPAFLKIKRQPEPVSA